MTKNRYQDHDATAITELLVRLANECGAEVLETSVNDLKDLSVSYLTQAVRSQTPLQTLDCTDTAVHYADLAELAVRAEELGIDRAALAPRCVHPELRMLSIAELRENSKPKAAFRRGQRLYLDCKAIPDPEQDSEDGEIHGFMEVIVTAVEEGHDYVSYQLGHITPDGLHVDVVDDWVPESELHLQIPDETIAQPERRRGHLTVVK